MHFLVLLSDKGWELPQGPWVAFKTTLWSLGGYPQGFLPGTAWSSLRPSWPGRTWESAPRKMPEGAGVASTRYSAPARPQESSVLGGFRFLFILYSP